MPNERKVPDPGAWRSRQGGAVRVGVVVAVLCVVALAVGLSQKRTSTSRRAESTFLAALDGVQADAPEADRVQLGKDICHLLRSGESPGAARRYFGTSDPTALAIQLTGSLSAATAPGSLCPDQAGTVQRWAAGP